MPQIKLPRTLAQYTNGQTLIELEAKTLFEVLSSLTNTYKLGSALLNENGSVQPYIGVVLDARLLSRAMLADPQAINVANAQIQIKTAFAGG
jgi:hypothetical protein